MRQPHRSGVHDFQLDGLMLDGAGAEEGRLDAEEAGA